MPSVLPATPTAPPMLWDVFCRVVDNFGDIGICWRLCADLASRGHQVRLWVDDPSALAWMAPMAHAGHWRGVQVRLWSECLDSTRVRQLPVADAWIEGFGCDIAPEFIAACAIDTRANGQNNSKNPVWINLEYLSAEAYVERSHGLPSPVMHGVARGRTRHFYYPGFTPRTGGLLRELGLAARETSFDSNARQQWLSGLGIEAGAGQLVSLFCYEPTVLQSLLAHWAAGPQVTHLLVTAGRATNAVQSLKLADGPQDHLRITYLPALSQVDYDHLLMSCDLNFVRGEDSIVRALWAGKPLVWQIYPQDDAAHHAKLEAFLDRLQAPPSMRQFHYLWNGVGGQEVAPAPLLKDLLAELPAWSKSVYATRQSLLQSDDLVTQLIDFVLKKR